MGTRKWHALNLMVRANANVACFFYGHEGLMEAQQTSLWKFFPQNSRLVISAKWALGINGEKTFLMSNAGNV